MNVNDAAVQAIGGITRHICPAIDVGKRPAFLRDLAVIVIFVGRDLGAGPGGVIPRFLKPRGRLAHVADAAHAGRHQQAGDHIVETAALSRGPCEENSLRVAGTDEGPEGGIALAHQRDERRFIRSKTILIILVQRLHKSVETLGRSSGRIAQGITGGFLPEFCDAALDRIHEQSALIRGIARAQFHAEALRDRDLNAVPARQEDAVGDHLQISPIDREGKIAVNRLRAFKKDDPDPAPGCSFGLCPLARGPQKLRIRDNGADPIGPPLFREKVVTRRQFVQQFHTSERVLDPLFTGVKFPGDPRETAVCALDQDVLEGPAFGRDRESSEKGPVF